MERRLLNCCEVARLYLFGSKTKVLDLPLSRWGGLDRRNEVELNVSGNEEQGMRINFMESPNKPSNIELSEIDINLPPPT